MSIDPDPEYFRRVYIEARIHDQKFFREIFVNRDIWDEFSEGERAAFARQQILKDVATNYLDNLA